MASTTRQKPPSATQAEITLLPSLKSCLVNLPSSLVTVLQNSNSVVVQNVVVELNFKRESDGKLSSVFLGWTGMRAQARRSGSRGELETASVEVDAAFGRGLGLREGARVRLSEGSIFVCFGLRGMGVLLGSKGLTFWCVLVGFCVVAC
jgi:hypothetical protein